MLFILILLNILFVKSPVFVKAQNIALEHWAYLLQNKSPSISLLPSSNKLLGSISKPPYNGTPGSPLRAADTCQGVSNAK